MNNIGILADLIRLRIFDAADLDASALLMDHYKVSDIVIYEMAGEIAKAILWKYRIQERETGECKSMDNGADHLHACEFPAEHTDWEYSGSHQCECGEVW